MARRRSIYETGAYQTPLADFLDEIPNYFLKFEQLKQAEANRQEEKIYRADRDIVADEQQRKNNLYRNEQAKAKKINDAFDDDFKMMNSLDTPSEKQQYFTHMIANNPRYEDKDLTSFSQALNTARTTGDSLSDLLSRRDEYNRRNPIGLYEDYAEIVTLAEELEGMRGKVGSKNKTTLNTAISDVGSMLQNIEATAGKPKDETVWTGDDKDSVKGLRSSIKSIQDEIDKLDVENQEYMWATYRKTDKDGRIILDEEAALKDNEIVASMKKKTMWEKKRSGYENKISNIVNKPEYRYPQITTAKEITEMSNVAKEQTRWVTEDAPDFHLYSPDDRLKLLGDEPVSAEEFGDMKTRYEDAKAKEKETKELGEAFAKKLGIYEDIDEDIPPMRMEPATEPIEGAEVEEDIFADLSTELQLEARKLQDRGMPDEQILAQLQEVAGDEPEPEPETGKKIPRIAEPLTARGDKDIEEVVAEQEKKMTETPLFKEPLAETGKYDVSDIAKGGKETGKIRGYANYALGENLKQLKDLRDMIPEMKEAGQKTWVTQSEKTIAMLEKKIKDSIGKYINPDTGEFSNVQYTERIYKILKRETFPELQMREIKDLLRALSTAKPYSKKVKKTFQAS